MSWEAARPARVEDVSDLLRLVAIADEELRHQRGGELWWHLHRRPLNQPGYLEGLLIDPPELLLVGTFDEAVVGLAGATRIEAAPGVRLGVLHEIYVEPEAREVAVGEALMDGVFDWCRQNDLTGLDSLVLPGMRHSKNFFESHGLTARTLLVHRALTDAMR